jgi:hypothetical protein
MYASSLTTTSHAIKTNDAYPLQPALKAPEQKPEALPAQEQTSGQGKQDRGSAR